MNTAVVQTVPRTVNTGLGAVFILAALAVLGGDSLTDFALALLLGIAVGTYSSMFTAAPLAVELDARSAQKATPTHRTHLRPRDPEPWRAAVKDGEPAGLKRAKPGRDPGDSGAVL